MDLDKLILFYVTVPNEDCAKQIAHQLLNKKLIACANILPPHQSLYTWNNKIETSAENIMILKTLQAHAAEVEKEILTLHPYDCPCILQIPVSDSNPSFLHWIKSETK